MSSFETAREQVVLETSCVLSFWIEKIQIDRSKSVELHCLLHVEWLLHFQKKDAKQVTFTFEGH